MKMFQKMITASKRNEKGMATAEYAVGTVGACGVGGILYKVGTSEWFQGVVQDVFSRIVSILPF